MPNGADLKPVSFYAVGLIQPHKTKRSIEGRIHYDRLKILVSAIWRIPFLISSSDKFEYPNNIPGIFMLFF